MRNTQNEEKYDVWREKFKEQNMIHFDFIALVDRRKGG